MILVSTGVTDIGRKSVRSLGFLTFATGVMEARFHCSGTVDVAREILKSWATGL